MSFFFHLLSNSGEAFDSFATFLAKSPPEKYASNPIILHDETYTNICPGSSPIEDPLDSSKLLMYVGEFKGNTSVDARVAVYRASKSDLYSWTRVGTFLSQGVDSTNHDENGVRFGQAIVHNGTVYYYYCGVQGSGSGSQAVCLATSTDGVTATKQGIVFDADQTNEYNFTDPYPFIDDDGTWYLYVSGKTSGAGSIPTLGIVVYSSDDEGDTWSRVGRVLELGAARGFDDKYIEGCSVFKAANGQYIMLYTTSSSSNVWSIGVAYASSPTATFTKHTVPWFQHSLSGWDGGSVAVEFPYQIGNKWYIFYQGTTQFQPADTWDIGIAELLPSPDDFPPGFIVGFGGWTGQHFFDTVDEVTVGDADVWARGLDNTGFATVYAEKAVDITAGVSSGFKATIRCNVGTSSFRGGFYLQEGSNIITGIYFNSTNISYLSSAGWATVDSYTANTNYEVEVKFTAKTTFQVWLDGVLIHAGKTPFTVISTKVDKLRLEKAQASTALVYFKNMVQNNLGVETSIDIGQ